MIQITIKEILKKDNGLVVVKYSDGNGERQISDIKYQMAISGS